MSSLRNTTGCWTCRLRKKKCDEQRPICENCSSRGIYCYGYGPAPVWMDGGGLEAEQVKEIKRAAAENYKARRSRWKVASLGQANGLPVLHDPDRIVKRKQEPDSRQLVLRQHRLDESLTSTSAISNKSSPSVIEENQINGAGDVDRVVPQSRAVNSSGYKSNHFRESQSLGSSPMDQIWWDCGLSKMYNIRNTHDLHTVMHYLNVVFPLKHGFYRSSSAEIGNSWLMSAFLRSEPYFYASLSLSVHHQNLMKTGNLNTPGGLPWKAERIYALTLKGLQRQVASLQYLRGDELLEKRFDVLGSMNEMLSVEVFRHLGGHWDIHLQAARTFLLAIGSTSFDATLGHCPMPNLKRLDKLEKILRNEVNSTLPSSSILALKFYVTCFIWADILSFAGGIGNFDANAIDYMSLLEDNIVRLENMMGCQNWVMIILLKIGLLEDLKKRKLFNDERIRHDLMLQAARLELSLNSGLSYLLEGRETLAGLDRDSNMVTEVFACAAITYLQVVVCGATSDVPEIRRSVTRTLQALSVLPERLLIRISWPFCITGCMVLPEEEHVLSDLISKANRAGETIGTVWKAHRVMQEVWHIRNTQPGSEVDWKTAMDRMGIKILLI